MKNQELAQDFCEKHACNTCGKPLENIDSFPGYICIKCYEKEFNKLSDKQKIPVFGKNLINI